MTRPVEGQGRIVSNREKASHRESHLIPLSGVKYCWDKKTLTYAGGSFTQAAKDAYRSHAWAPSVAGLSGCSQGWCSVVDSDGRNKYPPGA